MGKIRVKTLGDEEQSQKEQEKKARQEARKASDAAKKEAAATKSEVKTEASAETTTPQQDGEKTSKAKGKKTSQERTHKHSGRHTTNNAKVDKKTAYALDKAVTSLKEFKTSKFDETVELHINVTEKGINGQLSLPHGTGKKLRIVEATDALVEEIAKGVINFDVLIARPAMMPKLAKVARVLGPRGLMPNPKSGTVTEDVDGVTKKLSSGHINYKTEAQSPIIHLSVGKLSFNNAQIEENVTTVINSVGANKIKSATLKSTMSPGIRLQVATIK